MLKKNINKCIDHTILKPIASEKDVIQLCKEAKQYQFASVCINPCFVALAKQNLDGSKVKVCTVVGFPLGANTTDIKIKETKDAIKNGAKEIDMVINIGKLIEGNIQYVTNEIAAIKKACGSKILKVIIETSLLNESQKIAACKTVNIAKANFIKTSTGFSTSGATVDDIILFRKYCNPEIKIKASGGIKTFNDAWSMISAGADRIGTSNSIAIVNESNK